MVDRVTEPDVCTEHPDHFMPCSKCAGAACCPPPPAYADDDVTVYAGDCLDVLATLPAGSVDAVVTDPPYGLEFMGKDWDRFGTDTGNHAHREAPRFTSDHMGKGFDKIPNTYEAGKPYQRWCELWATECLRVLKPGGHLLAFGGTRTWHRLVCAVEDAGFEVRDSIDWIYGSGFPKSLNVGGRAGDEWAGWGSALKPAHEPIVVARKPFPGTLIGNVVEHGTGALNIDACRVAWGAGGDASAGRKAAGYSDQAKRALGTAVAAESPTGFSGEVVGTDSSAGRWPANVVLTHAADCELVGQRAVASDMHYPGARGRGGISVPGHAGQDGLEERAPGREVVDVYDCTPGCPVAELGDEARFFPIFRYEAKAGTAERPKVRGDSGGTATGTPADALRCVKCGRQRVNNPGSACVCPEPDFQPDPAYAGWVVHPTVKPLDLMRWLVRLVVPRGATVLDLFAGSGTTGEACIVEGMKAILIEREPTYLPLIVARVSKPIEATLL